jgi:hypothetical protein
MLIWLRLFDYSHSISIRCPCCSNQVNTVVNQESGNAAYFWAGVICFCVSPMCCCLPFMCDKCLDKNHYCPNCGFNVLRKHRGFFECWCLIRQSFIHLWHIYGSGDLVFVLSKWIVFKMEIKSIVSKCEGAFRLSLLVGWWLKFPLLQFLSEHHIFMDDGFQILWVPK